MITSRMTTDSKINAFVAISQLLFRMEEKKIQKHWKEERKIQKHWKEERKFHHWHWWSSIIIPSTEEETIVLPSFFFSVLLSSISVLYIQRAGDGAEEVCHVDRMLWLLDWRCISKMEKYLLWCFFLFCISCFLE